MRRILQVFNQYREFGGEEAIILELTRVLEKSVDLRNHFFRSNDWVGPQAPSRLKQASLSLYNPHSAATLAGIQRSWPADVWLFHNMLPVGSPSAYRAALRCRVPVIQYLHNYRPFSISGSYWLDDRLIDSTLRPRQYHEALRGGWNQSVAQGLVMATAMKILVASGWLEAVKAWVGVSPAICDHLAEAGIPRQKMFSLPPPWPSRPATSRPATPGKFFLYLGRLIPEKGILFLLDAWDQLAAEADPNPPRLVIAGMGPLEAVVRTRAAANPLVSFLGRVSGDEKSAALADCTALVIPSLWWDPNPTVVGEAFDYERPVIAARIGGLAYRVIENSTGLLYEPHDRAGLLQAVQNLHGNPARAAELGRNAKQWLIEQSDPVAWSARFAEIVETALAR